MGCWVKNERGQAHFRGGRQDWSLVSYIACNCPNFILDYEDELIAEEEISCYNCRFRRWTEWSFMCLKR